MLSSVLCVEKLSDKRFKSDGINGGKGEEKMAEKKKFCRNCGKPIREGATFCSECGSPISGTGQDTAVKMVSAAAGAIASGAGIGGALEESIQAIESSGEFDLGPITGSLASKDTGLLNGYTAVKQEAEKQINEILSPVSTLLSGLKDLGGGLIGMARNPSALIPAIIFAVLWILIPSNKETGILPDEIASILGTLTYAEGGLNRDTVIGTIAGTIGKGTVAIGLTELVTNGGFLIAIKGIGAIFKKGHKKSIGTLLIGIIIGIFLCGMLTGIGDYADGEGMVSAAVAFLSMKALGSESGFLYEMATSLTSKKNGKTRVAQDGKNESMLIGTVIGSILMILFP